MKKYLLITALSLASGVVSAQTQIGNSDMENWEAVTQGEEPVNWNSFMTASGSLNTAADVQIEQVADPRPGSAGSTSARIWSRNAGFGVVANGNMTCGQVNMGSIFASDISNHNYTNTTDADFSEAFTDMPDSIVFWVKYNNSDAGEEARMKATLHDDYNYQDPEDATSTSHVVATAEINYTTTNDTWTRMSVPFNYNGAASTVEYILVTFASNANPGGGNIDDEVFVDDIELIYNPNGLPQADKFPVNAFMNNDAAELNFTSTEGLNGSYAVYNMAGAEVLSGTLTSKVAFNQPAGVYMVHVLVGDAIKQFKVYNK